MGLPPRAGAGAGAVLLPVLAHWATLSRPSGWTFMQRVAAVGTTKVRAAAISPFLDRD